MDNSSAMFYTLVLMSCIFMYCVPSGSAIMCYECNTLNDTRCNDPFDKIASKDMLVNCSIEYPDATFCRKIDTTISAVSENKHRIFRRCAWEEHKNRDCYMGTSIDYKADVCICRTDGCNSAPQSMYHVQGLTIAAAAVGLILGLRHLMVVT